MLENIKGVRLNDQSDANLNSIAYLSAFKNETHTHKDSHRMALQNEDTVIGMVDTVSSRLMANSKLNMSNELAPITLPNRLAAGSSTMNHYT